MDLSGYLNKGARRASYSAPKKKNCRVCNREITEVETPRHLYYSGFCSENCKGQYMEGTDL